MGAHLALQLRAERVVTALMCLLLLNLLYSSLIDVIISEHLQA